MVALAGEVGSGEVGGEERGEESASLSEIIAPILGVAGTVLLVSWCERLIAFTVGKSAAGGRRGEVVNSLGGDL